MDEHSTLKDLVDRAELLVLERKPNELESLANELLRLDPDSSKLIGLHHKYLGVACYLRAQHHEAIKLLKIAFQLFNELQESHHAANVSSVLGNICLMASDLDTSSQWYNVSLELYRTSDDSKGIARVVGNLGTLFRHKSEYKKAQEHFNQALEMHRANGDAQNEATVMGNMGNLFVHIADYPQALEYYHDALEMHEKLGDHRGIARVTGNIGNVYNNTDDGHKAIEWFKKALDLRTKLNDIAGVASIQGSIGNALGKLGRHVEAINHIDASIEFAKQVGDTTLEYTALTTKASILLDLDRTEEADAIARSIKSKLDSNGLRALSISLEITQATIALVRNDLQTAMSTAKRCAELAEDLGKHGEEMDACMVLYTVYKEQGDFKNSLLYHERARRLEKKMTGQDKQRRLAILEVENKLSEERKLVVQERLAASERIKLLHSVLPAVIAERLIAGEKFIADTYDNVGIIFLDMVNFTLLSSTIPPKHLVYLLNGIFEATDEIIQDYGLTKIKTIGDAYLAVSGIPSPLADNITATANAAIQIMKSLDELVINVPQEVADTSWVQNAEAIRVRMGVHVGSVVAGVIGQSRTAYDIWGDAVNMAARMEQLSAPGRIHVSGQFAEQLLCATGAEQFSLIARPNTLIKGKGKQDTFWLESKQ